MIVFKAIKPKKLKVDAVRLELLSMVHKAGRDIKKDFEATTETWEHKPVFETMVSLKGGPTVLVSTDDEIYGYVDRGTPPHDIPAKKDHLTFRTGYISKTVPNKIGSRAGGKFGPYRRAKVVHHPGIEARNFDKLIAEKWRPIFKSRAEEALRRGVRKMRA